MQPRNFFEPRQYLVFIASSGQQCQLPVWHSASVRDTNRGPFANGTASPGMQSPCKQATPWRGTERLRKEDRRFQISSGWEPSTAWTSPAHQFLSRSVGHSSTSAPSVPRMLLQPHVLIWEIGLVQKKAQVPFSARLPQAGTFSPKRDARGDVPGGPCRD